MKEEDKIFKEWYELNFEELPSPLEYVYLRDSLEFQRYLLWYRFKELVKLIKGELLNIFKKLLSKVGSIRKRGIKNDTTEGR